jgi:ATP-dependent protease ClpP protease subunit
MLAIVDLIEQHGNCVGLLVGAAISSHSAIWTACQRRYVSPNASIGIHKVAWTDMDKVDSRDARLLTLESERTEQIISELLARISGKPSSHWFDMMQDAGSNGCKLIEAATLIKLGMAHPLADLDRDVPEVRRVG